MAAFPHVDYLTSITWDETRPVFESDSYDGTPHRRFKHANKTIKITATYTFFSQAPITGVGGIEDHYASTVNTTFTYWKFWEDADILTADTLTVWYDGAPKYKRKNSKVYTCTVKFKAVLAA